MSGRNLPPVASRQSSGVFGPGGRVGDPSPQRGSRPPSQYSYTSKNSDMMNGMGDGMQTEDVNAAVEK
eukprot:4754328-Pyramimonas_sp.AAC.1